MKALSRSTDPLTSYYAASVATGFAATHRAMILTVLRECGSMTAHEIANNIPNLIPHQILKRLPELYRQGLIVPTGETRSTGRTFARVWGIA